jgi:hypothetical protein
LLTSCDEGHAFGNGAAKTLPRPDRERAGRGGLARIDHCGNTAFEEFQPPPEAERGEELCEVVGVLRPPIKILTAAVMSLTRLLRKAANPSRATGSDGINHR